MKVIITGSSGFIGSYLTEYLAGGKVELQLLDLKQGIDICQWEMIKNLSGFDVIIHLANRSYVPDSYEHPHDFYKTNILSTLNMLELCRQNNAKLIYFSSYIYGRPDYLPIDEGHPVKAFNPYAQSKVVCEQLCKGYSRDFKLPVIIFRPFNIYGLKQNDAFLIPTMVEQAGRGKIEIRDDRPKRDYIHIHDVIKAIHLSLNYIPKDHIEIFNLGTGKSYSVKEVAGLIISKFSNNISFINKKEIRPNEVLDTVANIDKAKSLLGWVPEVDLEEGIDMLVSNKKI